MVKDRMAELELKRAQKPEDAKKIKMFWKKKSQPKAMEEGEASEMISLTDNRTVKPVIDKAKNRGKGGNELDKTYQHVNNINEHIAKIQEDVIQMRRYHVRVQNSTRTEPSLQEQIDSLSESIKASYLKIKNELRELENEKTDDESDIINRVVRTHHSLLSKRFRETMVDYENSLSIHKKICEDLIKKQLGVVIEKYLLRKVNCFPVKEVTEEQFNQFMESEDTAIFVDNYTTETLKAIQILRDVRERHKELLQLEKEITDLRNMFHDLAFYVSLQGAQIDKIDFHIGDGCDKTHSAARKLSKAEKYMASARKKKFWIILCLSSVIGILILIFVIQAFFIPGA